MSLLREKKRLEVIVSNSGYIEELSGQFGSFNLHILYFHARVVEKFEVIAEKCPKPYLLLSVLLLTDQMWRLISSSGLHFCLKHSLVNDLPLPDSS